MEDLSTIQELEIDLENLNSEINLLIISEAYHESDKLQIFIKNVLDICNEIVSIYKGYEAKESDLSSLKFYKEEIDEKKSIKINSLIFMIILN